jgi:DNA-binding transcriptional regulator YiaG
VQSLREQLQLDIPELAALTGIDENLLHDIEAGRQIQSRAIDRFFRVLDKDPNAIAHLASVP